LPLLKILSALLALLGLAASVEFAVAKAPSPSSALCLRLQRLERQASGNRRYARVISRLQQRCYPAGKQRIFTSGSPVNQTTSVTQTNGNSTVIVNGQQVSVPANGTYVSPDGTTTITNQSWSSTAGNGGSSVQINTNVHVESHSQYSQ
jgi:archaellum component FlaF (FlaF/FlaG flagellin family)